MFQKIESGHGGEEEGGGEERRGEKRRREVPMETDDNVDSMDGKSTHS